MKENYPIDFVMLWVDGNDENWKKERAKYDTNINGQDGRNQRFRSWDNLQMWFRGVEKYASWVNKIFFITCGQKPEWLDENNPKLRLVRHDEYIPKEYLPTFNSNVIEIHLHRIKDLSEHFVLFNDDMFLTHYIKRQDFFKKGLPVEQYLEYPVGSGINKLMPYIFINNNNIIAKNFSRKDILKNQRWKILNWRYGMYFFYNLIFYMMPFPNYFGVLTMHIAYPHLKSVIEEVWSKEYEEMCNTSGHRFRQKEDISHYLFRMWYLSYGRFVPGNRMKMGKMFKIGIDDQKLFDSIEKERYKIICVADEISDEEFEIAKEKLNKSLNQILSEKSSFEK